MRNIFLITLNVLKMSFRKKGGILVSILLPSIICIVTVLANIGNLSSSIKIGVFDKDNTMLSNDMIDAINLRDNFKTIAVSEDQIKELVLDQKVDCVMVIPESFQSGIYNGKEEKVKFLSIKGEDTTAYIESFVNYYIQGLDDISKASEEDQKLFNKMYKGNKDEIIKLKVEKLEDKNLSKNITYVTMGFLLMFVMSGAGFITSYIIREKRNKTFFRICSAPVKSKDYVLSNVLTSLIIVLIQVTLVVFVMTKVLNVNIFMKNIELFIILMCFGLVSIGIGLTVVAFSKTTNQVGTLNTLILTPTCMLGGCFWPVEVMPPWLQRIGDFVPQTWALRSILKLQSGGSFNTILPYIAILLSFAFVFILIAIYGFNRRNDVANFI